MEFLLGMQVPQNAPLAGMVHHKLHDLRWHPVPALPPERAGDERLLFPPSTAATLHVAAVGAQAARVWRDIDPAFAARCLAAAEAAWAAANANPTLYAGNTPGSGGGNYDDGNVSDEFYWAASELYLTTRNPVYRDVLTQSPHFTQFPGLDGSQVAPMSWQRTGALGTISLALHADALSPNEAATLQGQIIASADRYAEILAQEGYRLTLREHHYYWGSNSDVLNNALILSLAYRFTGEQRYLHIAAEGMDYLLGRNALRISFVSGYGSHSAQRMHHRFWANRPHEGYPPPPPGALAGGPNGSPSDPSAQRFRLAERAPAKRYIDRLESWSTNEVAINWNAPLVWVAAYLDANRPR
jgi:endoglucanase